MSEAVMQINLGTRQQVRLDINPSVIMQILDSYYRKQSMPVTKTVGTLLGVVQGDRVYVTSCYAIPIVGQTDDNNDDTIIIEFEKDMKYNSSMFNLNKQIYPDEIIVGAFVTNNEFVLEDVLTLTAEFSQKKSHFIPQSSLNAPIILTIDPRDVDNKYNIKGYMYDMRFESMGQVGKSSAFLEIQPNINFNREKLSDVASIIFNQQDQQKRDCKIVDTSNAKALTQDMINSLEVIRERVQGIISGKYTPDEKLGQQVKQLLSFSTKLSQEQFDTLFEQQQQDTALLQFLSNLAKTQNTISEKTSIVNIK